MRGFWKMMLKYVGPYKRFLAGSVVLNILSAVFNIFSFAMIVPMLKILFKMDTTSYAFIPWDSEVGFKDKLLNNVYYYVGYYNDRAADDIKKTASMGWNGIDWKLLWDARQATIPQEYIHNNKGVNTMNFKLEPYQKVYT